MTPEPALVNGSLDNVVKIMPCSVRIFVILALTAPAWKPCDFHLFRVFQEELNAR